MAEDAASGFDLDHTPAQSSEPWTPPSQSLDDPGPRWQCTRCYHDRFVYSAALDSWRCVQCGSFEYESVSSSSYSWTFHPDPPEPPPSSTPPRTLSSPSTPSWTPARDDSDRHAWDFGPPDDWSEAHEAGSESLMTNDPEVDPETLEPVPQKKSRRQRRAERRGDKQPPDPPVRPGPHLPVGSTRAQGLQVSPAPQVSHSVQVSPGPLVPRSGKGVGSGAGSAGHRPFAGPDLPPDGGDGGGGPSSSSSSHWNSRKGPEPGVKYRGGTPPSPPSWSYSREDLRAFTKWERKVRVWQVQIKSYLPANEAAMALYVSLRGEAEEELEHADLSLINHKDGIDFILDSLRTPFRYLSEFEQLNRFSGETIRSFCNRYARTERNLRSVQINIESMYDVESRGSRLMDRMRISLDQQRLLLTAAGNDLDVRKVREAAIIQFPDHRPTPPVVFSREFDFGRDRDRGGDDRTTHPKGKGKGSHKGKNRPRQTYVTEYVKSIPEDDEEAAEPSDAEPFDGEEAADEDAQEFNDEEEALEDPEQGEEDEDGLQEVIQCLTVTARRLQGLTLGRKYTGKRSIQDRKRTSHCAVCGEPGHWKGDPECQGAPPPNAQKASSAAPPKGSGKAKTKSKDATKSANSKKVYAVKFADGVTKEETCLEPHEESHQQELFGTYFTFVTASSSPCRAPSTNVPQVLMSNLASYNGYMVLDTACQRTCCSSSWLELHTKTLSKHRLKLKEQDESEAFQFGHGEPQYSFKHAYIPAGLNHTPEGLCLVGTSVLRTNDNNKIPLLASNNLLTHRLEAIIDLPSQQLVCQALGCTIPIVQVDGHLAVRIDLFPAQVHTSHVWKQLSQEDVWQDPDSELILCSQQSAAIKDFDLQASTSNASASSSSLVASMAAASPGIHRLRDHPGEVHAALHELGYPSKGMDCAPGSYECGHVPEPARHCHAALQASGTDDSTKRQQARPVCKVSGLRHEVDMEREKAGMGRSTFRKTLVAAIALFGELIGGYDAIFNSRGTSSGGQATDSTDEHIGVLKYGTTGTSFDGTSGQIQDPVLQHQQDGQSTSQFMPQEEEDSELFQTPEKEQLVEEDSVDEYAWDLI